MIHVTCAIIQHKGKVLICQRSARMKLLLKWEFPGGKIEPGESREDSWPGRSGKSSASRPVSVSH